LAGCFANLRKLTFPGIGTRLAQLSSEHQNENASKEKGMRALETLVVLTVVTVAFLWVILAHSTPEEHARLHDSLGQSTHIAWR